MKQNESMRIMMLLSIVQSGKGKKLMSTLKDKNIRMHFQSVGLGTAPTEMMDIFGLGTRNKDVIFSLANESVVADLMKNFSTHFSSHSEYGGLMIVLRPNAINRIAAEILHHSLISEQVKGEHVKMKDTHSHNLVMITVAQGYVDQVMETAKKAGATGGTVIKSRLADAEEFSEITNLNIEEEREIIFILAPTKVSYQIMEDVNKEYGIRSEAKSVMCTLPIDKAFRI